jgi:hypothetical protein
MNVAPRRALTSRAWGQALCWGLVCCGSGCAVDSRSLVVADEHEELGEPRDEARAGGDATSVSTAAGAALGQRTAVGAPCTLDADCVMVGADVSGAHCILSTSYGELGEGGPQGGYCSAPCESDADCQNLDAPATCNVYGYCVRQCEPGEGGTKCGVNRAQACAAELGMSGVGTCLPLCRSDVACGVGRFCAPRVSGEALCADSPPTGGDIGAPCSEQTAATDCASGLCITYPVASDTTVPPTFCSALCTLGVIAGCGFNALTAGPRGAACLAPGRPGAVGGDLGLCFELCDDASECSQAGWICSAIDPAQQSLIGRYGQCLPA